MYPICASRTIDTKTMTVRMNNDLLFSSTINDYLGMDHSGAYLHALVDKFHDAAIDLLHDIDCAIRENDHAAWRSHLHSLKGIAGIAGARHLHDLCDIIRARNNHAFTDNPDDMIMELRNAVDHYRDAIHQTLRASRLSRATSC